MTIPDRLTYDSIDPRWSIRITDDGSPTLVDRESGDSMHSGCGAIAETRHVYLHNSGVAKRLESGKPTRVLEVGLGSGMGCLLTAELAQQTRTQIEYVAIENKLTPAALIEQLDFEKQGVAPEIIGAYRDHLRRSVHQEVSSGRVGDFCTLTIHQCDAATWSNVGEPFDAIYFDPFSPESNPTLWGEQVLLAMRRCLSAEGRLVSYCVNRKVRDTLESVGFVVQRVAGPVGGKREVLVATASQSLGNSLKSTS